MTTEQGCDSIVTMHLTINETLYGDTTVIACNEYTWNDTTYTASGDYTMTFLTEQGCTDVLCGGLGQGAVNMLNQLGIRIHAGAPELPVEQVLAMFLNGTIVYGDPSCHHHCEGHH